MKRSSSHQLDVCIQKVSRHNKTRQSSQRMWVAFKQLKKAGILVALERFVRNEALVTTAKDITSNISQAHLLRAAFKTILFCPVLPFYLRRARWTFIHRYVKPRQKSLLGLFTNYELCLKSFESSVPTNPHWLQHHFHVLSFSCRCNTSFTLTNASVYDYKNFILLIVDMNY